MSQHQKVEMHRRLLTSSDDVDKSPDNRMESLGMPNIKTSNSRRSMGPPMELKKSIYELDVNANAGVTSQSATSPKYQEMLELLNRHGSSVDSAEVGFINEVRSPVSQQLEETQMLLRRRQLDYERLMNEFDHAKSRWELEREDMQILTKELNSKINYLQEIIRGLKAEAVCRDALMSKLMKIDKPSEETYRNLIEQYKKASEDLRETMEKRDSELTAARQSDVILRNRVEKLVTLKQESDKQSQKIPSKTNIEKNQILIEEKDDEETTLSSLRDCFEKLKRQNGQFSRILTGFRKQRLENRRRNSMTNRVIKWQLADPAESLRRQLSFTEDKLRQFQQNRQILCKQLEKEKKKIDDMKTQLDKEIETHRKSKQQLQVFKFRAQQLQSSIDELSNHIEQIARTNDQLSQEANRMRADKAIAQSELQEAKIRINELQRHKQENQKETLNKINTLEQNNLIQKLTFQSRISELQGQLFKKEDQRLSEQSEIIDNMRSQVAELMKQQQQLSKELLEKTQATQNMSEELSRKNQQIKELEAQLREMEENNQGLQKQLRSLKTVVLQLTNDEIPRLKAQAEDLMKSLFTNQYQLEAKTKQLNELETQLNFTNDECTRRQEEIDRITKEKGDIEARLTKEMAEVDKLVQYISRLQAEQLIRDHQRTDIQNNLQSVVKEKQEKLKQKQATIEELVRERKVFQQNQKNKLLQLQQLLAKKQLQIDTQRRYSVHMQSDLAIKTSMLNEMSEKCRTIEDEINSIELNQQKKLKIAQDQLEAARHLIQQQNNIIAASMKNEQFKQLMNQYKIERQEGDKMRESIMGLHQQLAILNDKVEDANNVIANKDKNIRELEKEKQQLNSLVDKVNVLQDELQQQREMTARLNNTTQELQEMNDRHANDQSKLSDLQSEVDQLKEQKVKMQIQIEQLCLANQQQLIHIKDEYKASLTINEQLRAAIVLMQKNETQPTLQLSSIAHAEKGSMLEGIPQEMLKASKDNQEASFLQDTVDDYKHYEEEIDRLANEVKDKQYFVVITELASQQKSLYNESTKDKLVEAFKKTIGCFKGYIEKQEEKRESIKKKAVAFTDTAEMIMSKGKIEEAQKSERSAKSDKIEKLDDKSGSSSVRLKKTALHKENNKIDEIFKQQETEEQMILSTLELKVKGEKSPEELSQTSLNRSQIKSQISEAQKASIQQKIDATNMRSHLNVYRKTGKKQTKK